MGSKADAGRMPTPTKEMTTPKRALPAREVGSPSLHVCPDARIASGAALLGNAFNPKLSGRPEDNGLSKA